LGEMKKTTNVNKLKRSRLYSEELGIKLDEKTDDEALAYVI